MVAMSGPKLFISYCWSSPEHEAWVLQLAEELVSQGIDVILDKWNLQPGYDAHAFMESMVTDSSVTKVLMICDQLYTSKSNTRSGGAGIEAQIITPELYSYTEQDKFVAVVKERDADGNASIPTYYKGRIFIDLSEPATYSEEYEKLVRWAWDQPLYVKPQLGEKPRFLTEDNSSIKISTSIQFRRAIDYIRNDRHNAAQATQEYFAKMSLEMGKFSIQYTGQKFDDIFIENIDNFLPYRNEIIELFMTIAMYMPNDEMLEVIHRFFEKLMSFVVIPTDAVQWTEESADNFRFIAYELFLYLIGSLIKYERFAAAVHFIETEYYCVDRLNLENTMHPFIEFCQNVRTIQHRNERLNLRRLSLEAELIKERAKSSGLEFNYLMTADLVLWLRGVQRIRGQRRMLRSWWPHTLVFVSFRPGPPFELFARARSKRYFEKIKSLLGVNDKGELAELIEAINGEDGNPRWQTDRLHPGALMQVDLMATTP